MSLEAKAAVSAMSAMQGVEIRPSLVDLYARTHSLYAELTEQSQLLLAFDDEPSHFARGARSAGAGPGGR